MKKSTLQLSIAFKSSLTATDSSPGEMRRHFPSSLIFLQTSTSSCSVLSKYLHFTAWWDPESSALKCKIWSFAEQVKVVADPCSVNPGGTIHSCQPRLHHRDSRQTHWNINTQVPFIKKECGMSEKKHQYNFGLSSKKKASVSSNFWRIKKYDSVSEVQLFTLLFMELCK